MNDSQLEQKFLDLILTLPKARTKKLTLIGLVGLIGSGKSTIATEIAELTGMYICSNDAIRRFLNAEGIPGTAPRQDLVQKIAEDTTEFLLTHNVSHIIDADIKKFIQAVNRRASSHSEQLILIRVECDESVLLKRLSNREVSGEETLSKATVDDYYARKKLFEQLPEPDNMTMTIHTDQPLAPQMKQLQSLLQRKGIL